MNILIIDARPVCSVCGLADCPMAAIIPAEPVVFEFELVEVVLVEDDAQMLADIERGEYCLWGQPGCACSLDEDELDDLTGEDNELARVIGEVRVGNILLPDEGEVLVDALIAEEQDHSETLADLYEAQDRVAELERELALKNELLVLAGDALMLAANEMMRRAEQDRIALDFALRMGYLG